MVLEVPERPKPGRALPVDESRSGARGEDDGQTQASAAGAGGTPATKLILDAARKADITAQIETFSRVRLKVGPPVPKTKPAAAQPGPRIGQAAVRTALSDEAIRAFMRAKQVNYG